MKNLLFILLAYMGLSIYQAQQSDSDRKATQLLSGMYEVVSWHDGIALHVPPAVVGRWSNWIRHPTFLATLFCQ